MTKDETLKLALDALENCRIEYDYHGNPMDVRDQDVLKAITAIKFVLDIEAKLKDKNK